MVLFGRKRKAAERLGRLEERNALLRADHEKLIGEVKALREKLTETSRRGLAMESRVHALEETMLAADKRENGVSAKDILNEWFYGEEEKRDADKGTL